VNRRVQEGIASAAATSGAVGQSLDRIVGLVRDVDGLVTSINTASGEQKQGLHQISTAMSHIDGVTQTTASGAEEAAAAAEELSAQTQELRGAIGSLLELIGWKDANRRKASVPMPPEEEKRRFSKLAKFREAAGAPAAAAPERVVLGSRRLPGAATPFKATAEASN